MAYLQFAGAVSNGPTISIETFSHAADGNSTGLSGASYVTSTAITFAAE